MSRSSQILVFKVLAVLYFFLTANFRLTQHKKPKKCIFKTMFSLAGNPSGAGGDVPRRVRARHLPHHHRQHAVHARVRKQHGPLPSTGPSNSTFQVGTGYQKIINCKLFEQTWLSGYNV